MRPLRCLDDNDAAALVGGNLDPASAAELAAHAAECQDCDRLLVQAAQLASAGSDRGEPAEAADEAAGRYVLERRLGEGGMGVVHAALDTRLGRRVAIKLLRPEIAGGVASEARALARVVHPNVLVVFDSGRWRGPTPPGIDEGAPYVVMELVEGWSARRWIEEARPGPEAILSAYRAAGEALAAIHAAGLVHGDFKPDNVLVRRDGEIRVSDFGLARPAPIAPAPLSARSCVAGTPAYMAPEQLAGAAGDASSDQFAFCVSLVESLSGTRPYVAADTEGLRRLYAQGPRPTLELPAAAASLRAILERGLALDPARRFGSMRELLDALAARTASRASSSAHVRAHAAINGALAIAHWVFTAAMLLGASPSLRAIPNADVLVPGELPGGEPTLIVSMFVIFAYVLWLVCFGPIGALLAPLNAYGLASRRSWARWTTLLYAAMMLPVCCVLPYSLYAFATLAPGRARDELRS